MSLREYGDELNASFFNHELIPLTVRVVGTIRRGLRGFSSRQTVSKASEESHGEQLENIQFFLKFARGTDYRLVTGESLKEENEAYERLSKYLPMPKCRLTSFRDKPVLVIKRAEGIPLDELFRQSPMECAAVINSLIEDVMKMWKQTARPMDETELVRNRRTTSAKTAVDLREAVICESIQDAPLRINGKVYPTLRHCLEMVQNILEKPDAEAIMVLEHGDLHYKNIFFDPQSARYTVIDPLAGGYNYPEATLNTIIGYPLLFVFDYSISSTILDDGTLDLTFEVTSEFAEMWEAVQQIIQEVISKSEQFVKKKQLLRAFIFINLCRSLIDKFNPMNLEKTTPNKLAHFALAVQLFIDLDDHVASE